MLIPRLERVCTTGIRWMISLRDAREFSFREERLGMNRRQISSAGVIALSVLLMGTAGCKQLMNANGMKPASDSVNQSAKVNRYAVKGMVLGKSAQTNQVVLAQDEIRGYKPAMDATYTLTNADTFSKLQPGDRITAEVIVPENLSYKHLINIKVVSQPSHRMTMAELPPHQLLVGESVPGTAMVNQDGKPTALTDFRGKAVLITFVDTQCTDDCPIVSHMFAEVDRELAKDPKVYAKSDLITISIDPAHDTPAVLHAYGLKYLGGKAAGFAHWQFVHMSPENLKRLATDFGVSYERSKTGDIEHTMDISLIGPDNTLQQSWSGDDWDPTLISRAVKASVENGNSAAPVVAKKSS
jgi:protein SCO1/2